MIIITSNKTIVTYPTSSWTIFKTLDAYKYNFLYLENFHQIFIFFSQFITNN